MDENKWDLLAKVFKVREQIIEMYIDKVFEEIFYEYKYEKDGEIYYRFENDEQVEALARKAFKKVFEYEEYLDKNDPGQLFERDYLSIFYEKYSKNKNPLYVWEAINYCSAMEKDFPEWIREYLFNTSLNLLASKAQESKNIAHKIKRIFGFKDKRHLNEEDKIGVKMQVYFKVKSERERRLFGDKKNIYPGLAKELEESEDTIKAYFQEMKRNFETKV